MGLPHDRIIRRILEVLISFNTFAYGEQFMFFPLKFIPYQ